MRRIAEWAVCLAILASCSGCLCRCATDCYGDVIDDISDHNLELDCLYCPAFDLTRIGFPDWCQCPINWALDCEKCSCNLPYYGPRNRTLFAYYNSPLMFQNSPATTPPQAIPPVPTDDDENMELPPTPVSSAGYTRVKHEARMSKE